MKTAVKIRYDSFVEELFRNGFRQTDAALAVKYSPKSARNAASILMKKPYIIKLIEERLAEQRRIDAENREKLDITVEEIRNKHRELMDLSQRAKDYANATRNLEGLGKMIGVYKESASIDDPARQIDVARRAECQRLAAIRITEMLLESEKKG